MKKKAEEMDPYTYAVTEAEKWLHDFCKVEKWFRHLEYVDGEFVVYYAGRLPKYGLVTDVRLIPVKYRKASGK